MDQIINIIKKKQYAKEAAIREPLILKLQTYHITEDVCRPIEDKAPKMSFYSIWDSLNYWLVWCRMYIILTWYRSWSLGIK